MILSGEPQAHIVSFYLHLFYRMKSSFRYYTVQEVFIFDVAQYEDFPPLLSLIKLYLRLDNVSVSLSYQMIKYFQ